jgi:hypothetical protein
VQHFSISDLRTRFHELDLGPARYLNMGLASWLLISAYVWRHAEPQFLFATFVGAVVAIVAPFGVNSPLARKICMAAGGLLALGAVALPHASWVGFWHNLIIGLLIAGIAYLGPPHGRVPIRPEAPLDAYEATGGV